MTTDSISICISQAMPGTRVTLGGITSTLRGWICLEKGITKTLPNVTTRQVDFDIRSLTATVQGDNTFIELSRASPDKEKAKNLPKRGGVIFRLYRRLILT